MFEKIAIFILFLGPLVFFHELGHFLFARLFGVRVEVFSIGFGPKLFKFKRGDTEYALSLIPLGGYVKMFGDDPLTKDQIPAEQKKFSFTFKGKWARFWIVMGGPLANFILAYVILFVLLLTGERLPEIRIGVIPKGSTFYQKGIRSGDVLQKVNNEEVYSPSDIVLDGDHHVKTITVLRQEQLKQLTVNLQSEHFFQEFVKYPAALRKPIVVDSRGEKYAISRSSEKVFWDEPLDSFGYGDTKQKSFFVWPLNDKGEILSEQRSEIVINHVDNNSFLKGLSQKGFQPLDMAIKSVNMKSAADEAGLRAGDVILKLEGQEIFSFNDLRETLQGIGKETISLVIWNEGKEKTIKLTPQIHYQDGKETKLIGVYSSVEFIELKFVETSSKGFFASIPLAFKKTWGTVVKTIEGFKKLITGSTSFKNIGGPLAIGKVASDSFNTSLSYFFQLMALISVNLGVINLFPIPVLDGGHIMFIVLEIFNGGPLSRRKMEIAQQVGLSILLMLMVGAIFNDFSRFF